MQKITIFKSFNEQTQLMEHNHIENDWLPRTKLKHLETRKFVTMRAWLIEQKVIIAKQAFQVYAIIE